MVNFIVRMIEKNGQEKYRAYFINTNIYEKYKAEVDARLIADDYGDLIVTE